MNWVKDYEIGIPLIDTQHRQLFRFNEKSLTPPLVHSVSNELSEWINDHVTGMGQEFGKYYSGHH